jgi:hypothetical protein
MAYINPSSTTWRRGQTYTIDYDYVVYYDTNIIEKVIEGFYASAGDAGLDIVTNRLLWTQTQINSADKLFVDPCWYYFNVNLFNGFLDSYVTQIGDIVDVPFSIVPENGEGHHITLTVQVNDDAPVGNFKLVYARQQFATSDPDKILETVDIEIAALISFFIPAPLVPPRPIDYDPDLGWDEENSVWTPTARGGGRYRQQFIAIGEEGEIYYGDT